MNQQTDRNSPQPGNQDQGQLPTRDRTNVDDVPGNARGDESGRAPRGGEQGISNRPDDKDPEPGSTTHGA